jgi:hypothetical protein
MSVAIAEVATIGRPYSFTEASKVLNVSPSQLDRLAKRNLVKCIWIGERRFLPADEVARIAREGTGR